MSLLFGAAHILNQNPIHCRRPSSATSLAFMPVHFLFPFLTAFFCCTHLSTSIIVGGLERNFFGDSGGGLLTFSATPLFLRRDTFSSVDVCLDSLIFFCFKSFYLRLRSIIRCHKSSIRLLGGLGVRFSDYSFCMPSELPCFFLSLGARPLSAMATN